MHQFLCVGLCSGRTLDRPTFSFPQLTKPAQSTSSQHLHPGNLDFHRFAFTLASLCEPSSQPFRKPLGRQSKAGLHESVRYRQRVIKVRRIREIAHTELVQPVQWATSSRSSDQHIHLKFLRIHERIRIAPPPFLAAQVPFTRRQLASRLTRPLNWFDPRRSRVIPPGFDSPCAARERGRVWSF
jgi:hypothetical protein